MTPPPRRPTSRAARRASALLPALGFVALLAMAPPGAAAQYTDGNMKPPEGEEVRGDLPVPAAGEADESRPLSREERLRQHRERMLMKLEEARQKKQEEHKEAFIKEVMSQVEQEQLQRQQATADRAREIAAAGGELTGAMTSVLQERQGRVRAALLDRIGVLIHPKPGTLVLDEGDRGAVDYVLYNRNAVEATHYTLALAYPPWGLRPVAIYAEAMARTLGREPFVYHDTERGLLTIQGVANQPVAFKSGPLVTVVWEGVAPMREEAISFVFRRNMGTSVTLGTEDRLGMPDVEDDGVLTGRARVRGLDLRPEVRRYDDGGLIAGYLEPEREVGELGVFLAAMYPMVPAGEEVFVAVCLNNPDRVAFNAVDLHIRFDPALLEVIDDDATSQIRRGVNIADAADLARFGFDHFLANEADNEAGIIRWRAASSLGSTSDGGMLAAIRFRAKQPADLTRLAFVHPDGATTGAAGTRVLRLGRDVLRRDPLEEGAFLRLLPERDPRELLEPGGLIIVAEEPEERQVRRGRADRQRRLEMVEGTPLEVAGARAMIVGEGAKEAGARQAEEEATWRPLSVFGATSGLPGSDPIEPQRGAEAGPAMGTSTPLAPPPSAAPEPPTPPPAGTPAPAPAPSPS